MSDLAKKARAAMKAKAQRLGADRPLERVDSSDFVPPEMLNADVKTGLRPVSRRAYKSGGSVSGETCTARADRKPRKAGGKAEYKAEATEFANAKVNRNVKDANEEREGKKHIGGMKSGGRADKNIGGFIGRGTLTKDGKDVISPTAPRATPERKTPPLPPRIPARPVDPGMSAEEAEEFMRSRKSGGRAKKADGGYLKFKGDPVIPGMKKGGKAHSDEAMDKALIKKMVKPEARTARKSGGKVKGKTNINIVIAAGKPAGGQDMMQPPSGVPTDNRGAGGLPIPVPPPQGAQGGAPMPMPIPMPMPMHGGAGGPPPGGGMPMARKSGGRITKTASSYKDMQAGAGSGEGRLQKTDIAKKGKDAPAYKAGGKVYRSYKDMDAGAGSGRGRLEKTEIESRKH